MDEINCIVCEKPIKFPSYIDPDDYDGHIFCHECNLLLYVKIKSSKVKKYKVVEKQKIIVQSEPPNIIFQADMPRPKKQKEK
jgi:DNA-directed RNA polymerase subunit RPC12/RpoP